MGIQEVEMAGILYLVATPIGNLEDMTFRAVRVLKEVDLIAAEDTRNSIKLLNHFEIQTPMTSYHEFNKYEKGRKLVEKLLEYKMYKYMSFELRDRQVDAARNMYREQRLPKEVEAYRQPIDYEELIGDMNLNKLHEIFKSIVKKQEDKIDPVRSQYGNIEKDEVDMDIKMLYVEAYAREHKTFSFRKLLEKQNSKMEVIVTFLIILELMKTGKINISQENIFDDIMITSNV